MEYKHLEICHVSSKERMVLHCEANGTCPVCRVSSNNNLLRAFYTNTATRFVVFIERICHDCGEINVSRYVLPLNSTTSFSTQYRKCTQLPAAQNAVRVDDAIANISPRFKEIYRQAVFTESQDCNEICGMGYRKALEFLIKDYLIHKSPQEREAISTESLSQSIKRIEDNRIKVLANRSAWLGNDECHYMRKHEDYGIDDLKVFIEAMLSYISSELTFEKALEVPYKP